MESVLILVALPVCDVMIGPRGIFVGSGEEDCTRTDLHVNLVYRVVCQSWSQNTHGQSIAVGKRGSVLVVAECRSGIQFKPQDMRLCGVYPVVIDEQIIINLCICV